MPTGDATLDIAKTPDGTEIDVLCFIGVASPIIYRMPKRQDDDMDILLIIVYQCLLNS